MRDLYADWKKWTMVERISALGGLCVMVVLVPVLTVAAVLTHGSPPIAPGYRWAIENPGAQR